MKNSTIFFALCFCLSLLTTSCTKTCHGGGWYGNRNLSSIDMKKPVKKTIATPSAINKVSNSEITCSK